MSVCANEPEPDQTNDSVNFVPVNLYWTSDGDCKMGKKKCNLIRAGRQSNWRNLLRGKEKWKHIIAFELARRNKKRKSKWQIDTINGNFTFQF